MPPDYGERGYQPRPCNFDMNDNGVYGEPEDCTVCDGVTADPDGDGVDEDLIYVDCGAGTDDASCGDPASPCATLEYAWGTRADGPDDGAEDIMCFTGVCTPNDLRPAHGGLTTTKIEVASGSQERDWELPRDPVMIVGWDRDGDGEYPPVDSDDQSVLDGTGLDYAFDFSHSPTSHLELAHFSATEYGRVDPQRGGFLEVGPSHLYVHDIQMTNINRETDKPSGRIVFGFFSTRDSDWTFIRNISCQECGGYFTRGSAGDGPDEGGPFRFQNIYLAMHPCSFGEPGCAPHSQFSAGATISKFWGYMNGVEWLDNVFDGQPDNRTLGDHGRHQPGGIGFAQCARNGLVRNNEFINSLGVNVQGHARGFCDGASARSVDGIVVEDNIFRIDYPADMPDANALNIFSVGGAGDEPGEQVGNVTFTRNEIIVDPGSSYRSCLSYRQPSGVAIDDTITFTNNVCGGPNVSQSAAINVDGSANMHRRFVIENNTVSGLAEAAGMNVIVANEAPAEWNASNNHYDAAAGFMWLGQFADDLAAWQGLSGSDATSTE